MMPIHSALLFLHLHIYLLTAACVTVVCSSWGRDFDGWIYEEDGVARRKLNKDLRTKRESSSLSAEAITLLTMFYSTNVLLAISGGKDWFVSRGDKVTSTKTQIEKHEFGDGSLCAK